MYQNKIRKYRMEKGMKLDEMAKKVGISIGYLCHLEKGTRINPSTRNNAKNSRNFREECK